MKYLYLILSILSILTAYSFDWYITGNEAIAATNQVVESNYGSARTEMKFWNFAQASLIISFIVFAILFVKNQFFKKI